METDCNFIINEKIAHLPLFKFLCIQDNGFEFYFISYLC